MLKLLRVWDAAAAFPFLFFYVKDFLAVRRQEINLYFNESVVADDSMQGEL